MKSYYQLIPEKVFNELGTILELLRPTIKGFSEDYLREVISIVAVHVRKDEEDPPLRSEYMRHLVPYAERHLNGLIELQIVNRSPYYIPRQISYRYTFTRDYQSKYITLPLTNARFINRISKAHSEIDKDAVKMIWGYSSQVKY
jgi:hypothetical protein